MDSDSVSISCFSGICEWWFLNHGGTFKRERNCVVKIKGSASPQLSLSGTDRWILEELSVGGAVGSDTVNIWLQTWPDVNLTACHFSTQGRPCNRLHFRTLPDCHRVGRLHLSTLGHSECHRTQHLSGTHRLHSLWCCKQTQQRSIYYWWDGSF